MDGVAFNGESAADFSESRCVVVGIKGSLGGGTITLVVAVHEHLRNSIHTIVISSDAAFFSVVRVAAARPIHLILGISEFARIVVAEVEHGGIDADAWSAGR